MSENTTSTGVVKFDTPDGCVVVTLHEVAALERNDSENTLGVLLRSGQGFRVAGMDASRTAELFEALALRVANLDSWEDDAKLTPEVL